MMIPRLQEGGKRSRLVTGGRQALELRARRMMITDYRSALDFIYSFIDYGSEPVDRYSSDSFELGRIRDFMGLHEDPQLAYPAVHIAGTKGKGSVSAMVASVLAAAGYDTGLYTSPHLIRFNERIQFNGGPIPDHRVVEIAKELKPTADRHPDITTYELITALGFIYFKQELAQVGVFEVGLGGRLDATNIVRPLATAITSVSLDHTQILGETVSEIAAEKGGIIKPDVPLVLAPQVPEARDVLVEMAHGRNAPVQFIGKDWVYRRQKQDLEGQSFTVWTDPSLPEQYWIPLLGEHQVENAATARAIFEIMRGSGFGIPERAVRSGFKQLHWPGRFQIVQADPPVVLDSCHNADSARRLRQTVEEVFPEKELILVFGASEDKDILGMLRQLGPAASRTVLTMALHPRAANPQELIELAQTYCEELESRVPVKSAVELGMEYAREGALLVITGSLFVVGEALQMWTIPTPGRVPAHPKMESS